MSLRNEEVAMPRFAFPGGFDAYPDYDAHNLTWDDIRSKNKYSNQIHKRLGLQWPVYFEAKCLICI